MHQHDGDAGGDERLRGRQIVELVGDPWREAGLRAEMLDDRAEAPGGRVASRQDQRLGLQIGNAHGVAPRQPVALGHDHVEVIDEQGASPQARGLGHRHAGHVVHHREVGVAAAEALDGLVGLELEDLDDEL